MIENAVITDVYFGLEEHCILTLQLTLKRSGKYSSGGFGNINLRNVKGQSIEKFLKTFNVLSFDDLKELPIRVKTDDYQVVSVGHLMEDRWFSYEDFKS